MADLRPLLVEQARKLPPTVAARPHMLLQVTVLPISCLQNGSGNDDRQGGGVCLLPVHLCGLTLSMRVMSTGDGYKYLL